MNKERLRTNLNKLVGRMTLPTGIVSAISDMDELLSLWSKYGNSGDREIIEERMTKVIKDLPVDDAEGLPEWFLVIVGDVNLLPTNKLRAVFMRKAEEISAELM